MNEQERLTGLLGMARRAGRLIAGFDAVKESLVGHRAQIVLLATDLSPKTEKELRFAAEGATLCATGMTKEEIGHAIGHQKPVGVVATEDRGFAAAMKKAADSLHEEDGI